MSISKYHLDRIKEKYGWTGGSYRNLMTEIIANETGNISRAVARLNNDHYKKALNKLPKEQRKRFIVPDVSEVLPKRSIFLRKSADRGKLLTDDLRDSLTRDLRKTFQEFTPGTGEQAFLKRRGMKAGQINERLVQNFQKRIEKTFQGYTRKDPRYGVPANINQIAVTEVRSTANTIKANYVETMLKKNPGVHAEKKWIHNKSLSKKPRPHHMAMDGKTVKWGERFMLESGVAMLYPHDPEAPPEEVISCHCDFEIYLVVPRRS